MAESSFINPFESTYHSDIASSEHGNIFQKHLFLITFVRLTLAGCNFRLAYEMAEAGKFDDVVVFHKDAENEEGEWWLFQAKHADTSRGPPAPITYNMLFPNGKDPMKGDFNLYKYLFSYAVIRNKFRQKKRIILFTNKDLDSNVANSRVKIVLREPIKCLKFSGRHIGLEVKACLIENAQKIVNLELQKKASPALVDEDTVKQFFEDLVLFVKQPDDLCPIISNDLQVWMKTWLRPEYFGRLDDTQLKKPLQEFEVLFNKLKTSGNQKGYLEQVDGEKCFDKIKTARVFKQKEFCPFYINRRIIVTNSDGSEEIDDTDFVRELAGKFYDTRVFLLCAEPGMGKTTIFEYIAHKAQQIPNRIVYLIHLNMLRDNFEAIERIDNLDEALDALYGVLSEAHFETIKNENNQFSIFFDAFDEIDDEKSREKVLTVIKKLQALPNVQILIDGRNHVKELLEKQFGIKAMRLVSFDEKSQISFFRRYWKVPISDKICFHEYATRLLNLFHTAENQALYKFTGLPLTLRMLADVKKDSFEKYLRSTNKTCFLITNIGIVGIVDLYEQFIEQSFRGKMNKLSPNFRLEPKDYKTAFERFKLEHQLLAIRTSFFDWKKWIQSPTLMTDYEDFEKRIYNQTDKSSLIEVVNNRIQFVHLSYAEFLVAQFIYFDKQNFHTKVMTAWPRMEWRFFFAMLEKIPDTELLDIIKDTLEDKTSVLNCLFDVQGFNTIAQLMTDTCGNIEPIVAKKILFNVSQKNCFKLLIILIETYGTNLDFTYTPYTTETIFTEAVLYGSLETVKLMIEANVDINCTNKAGISPLHMALIAQEDAILKLLIENNANPNIADNWGTPPTHVAMSRIEECRSKGLDAQVTFYSEMLRLMIENLDDINELAKFGIALLHYAAEEDVAEAARLLLDSSANVNVQGSCKLTPLHLAARYNHVDVIKLLVEYQADVNATDNAGSTPLHIATRKQHQQAVEVLLKYNANSNISNKLRQLPVHLLISRIRECRIKYLKAKFDIQQICTAGYFLSFCLLRENESKVCASLEEIVENASNDTPLGYDTKLLELLIEKVDNVHYTYEKGTTLLHHAAKEGVVEAMCLLINRFANINAQDEDGQTPLHIATRKGFEACVKLLLQHNANQTIANKWGQTPAQIVISCIRQCRTNIKNFTKSLSTPSDTFAECIWRSDNYNKKIIKSINHIKSYMKLLMLMLEKKDIVEATYAYGETLLHHAAKKGCEEVVHLLLQHSANVSAQDMDNRTPLHLATLNNHVNVIKLILVKTLDIHVADNDGMTPLSIAQKKGYKVAEKLLLEHYGTFSV